MAKISSRGKLLRIRTAQGWRAAYHASGLPDTGSDATKRRRLSRAINKKTSGYKPLSPTQSKRINRSYGQRKRGIASINAQKAINMVNRLRAEVRRTIRGTDAPKADKDVRLNDNQSLTEDEEEGIRKASTDPEEWDDFRAEYANILRKVNPALLPSKLAIAHNEKLRNATR